MRADRLVATLLVLQARGRITASGLARELEISERTARRDLEALAVAGVPVYSRTGRGGGWYLVGGARTDLSGLTAAEARALFLVAGPAAQRPEIKAALRKLVRALPETFRADAEAAASAVVVDPTGWDGVTAPVPTHLDILQRAIVDGVRIRLGYAGRDRPESERTVHPFGLVAKGPVWYLIGNTDAGLRTFRLSRVRSVQVTDEPVERLDGFDLDTAWQTILATLDERRLPFRARVRTDAGLVAVLQSVFGTRLSVQRGAGADRVELEIRGASADIVAAQLAGFGRSVEVIDPAEVRSHLARIGAELVGAYGPAP
jgi:predicted DNA-binding transcriptional regulator YafY